MPSTQLEINYKKGEHIILLVGGNKDFIVFNSDFEATSEEINMVELQYKNTEVISEMKSMSWSANCKNFFVVQEEGIYLMNVYTQTAWFNNNHSKLIFDLYLSVKDGKKRKHSH